MRFEIGCHRSMLLVVYVCCSFMYNSRVRWKRGAGSLELVDVMEEELSSILACAGPHICRTGTMKPTKPPKKPMTSVVVS